MRTYRKPEGHTDVKVLVPESSNGHELTPSTPVLCIHRGRKPFTDKFDGIDYVIEPGKFEIAYGAAKHFQDRAVIPGTRDPEVGSQQSYIGIIGLDEPALCEPLTDEECERFGAAVEAIDRSTMISKEDRDVTVVKTGVRATRGAGGKRPDIKATKDDVMAKTGQSDAKVDAREARG